MLREFSVEKETFKQSGFNGIMHADGHLLSPLRFELGTPRALC